MAHGDRSGRSLQTNVVFYPKRHVKLRGENMRPEWITSPVLTAWAAHLYPIKKRQGIVPKGWEEPQWRKDFMEKADRTEFDLGTAMIVSRDAAERASFFPVFHYGRQIEKAFYDDTGEEAPAWAYSVFVFDEGKVALGKWDPRNSKAFVHAVILSIEAMVKARPSRFAIREE